MDSAEQRLLERCLAQEPGALEELVEYVEAPLANFLDRFLGDPHLAEDLFQEAVIRMMRALPRFRPLASLRTWVLTIARNLCLDYLKHRKVERSSSLESAMSSGEGRVVSFREILEAKELRPEEIAEKRERESLARELLTGVPPKQREALILRYFEGLPYQQIAEVTGVPVGTAKYRVHEAIVYLARAMRAREDNRAEERGSA